MARATLTKTIAPGAYAGAGIAVTMTAANVADKNQFITSGKDLILAFQGGVAERHVTITSVADPYGRTGDIAADHVPAAAGSIRMYGPFPTLGWRQVGSQYIYLEADNAEVFFGVVTLP
jgi:hypothetical protein